MVNAFKRPAFWYCLTLALAISLGSVGLLILVDFSISGSESVGRPTLRPGGGLVALALCASLLALLLRLRWLATGLGLGVIALASLLTLTPRFSGIDWLETVSLNPLLLLVVTLISLSGLAAMHLSRGWVVGLACGPLVLGIGLLSLLSHWHGGLLELSLGSITESTLVISPMAMLIGLTLPFLYSIYHSKVQFYSKGLLVLGILGILVTTLSWHALRLQSGERLIERAESLASQLEASSNSAFEVKLALIRRLAERWELLNGVPPENFWDQEVGSYLRDFPDLRLITILNREHEPVRTESRTLDYRGWLEVFLSDRSTRSWLDHVTESRTAHLSRPLPDNQDHLHAAVAVPITPGPGYSWTALAVVDLQTVYEGLTDYYGGKLHIKVFHDDDNVFDTAPEIPADQEALLASQQMTPHHDSQRRIEVYTRKGSLPPGELYLPPAVLFTGLGLSFLVMLSHFFWRQSEQRARNLAELNLTLSQHLEEERDLRTTNETLSRERDQFFALSPDMFCIVDLNSHFFELNETFILTLGYTREQLLGSSYMNLVLQDDHAKTVAAVKSLVEGHEVKDLQIRVLDSDGGLHWLQINAILSADDLIYVVARDMTEQLEIEDKLRENEALLKMAERQARIGGWAVDLATGKATWSDTVCDIHELPRGQVPEVNEAINYYVDEHKDQIRAAVQLCAETGLPFDEELQIRTARGNLRWVRTIGHAVQDDDGNIVKLQGAFQDITESRQAMEQLRRFADRQAKIFESITDAFYTLDNDWRFTYVNRKSEELLHKKREDLLGHNIWEVFPDTIGTTLDDQYHHAVETGNSVSFEFYYPALNEWLEISAYPSEEGLAVYYRSIRERKEAQQQLESAMAELERSNRELQDFAFVASHDLQEPLRKIQAFSDRLMTRSDQFGLREQDYLNRMQSAAGRMQQLIEDLLSYSRVTTRARPMALCHTDDVLAGVLQDLDTAITREQARIDVQPLPDVVGDATQLRQVFQNLLTNAIKFHAPDTPPEISVYAEDVSDSGWTLVVQDRGIGFDPRYTRKLFHPFQRLHSREGYAGTGIGMAIVKKILDRHGAEITVASVPGEGTTFRIRFRSSSAQEQSKDE
ncbi:PAS domain S-box protein [Marinobacter pelagius]|uniref:PAS domain S-box protein n=1 Tax=Marinobacter sp. C7 TaxID=2951363 RepID=UPI001EF0D735|nr:PAS domain S-box protein [Marinobacter sp. C7]MCG7200071.1 PAS domain S-box protein [Marinobacter sp. C7]